jgi:hypothetical protein
VALHVQQVHRAAAPVGDPGLLAEQLSHHRLGGRSKGEGDPVVAVAGEDVVVPRHGGGRPHHRRFFADVQVQVAPDPVPGVLLLGTLFESADQYHLAVQPEELFVWEGRLKTPLSGRNRAHMGSTGR